MSGLLERIVRRRRASASSRLGPSTQNGHPSSDELASLNGHPTELVVTHVNGSAGAVEAPEVVDEVVNEAQAAESLEVVEVVESLEQLDVPEALDTTEAEPQAIEVPEAEPPVEDSDEPALLEDESPTMEHRVLVLDELEHDDAEEDPAAQPEAIVADEPEAVGADQPEAVGADQPEAVVADQPEGVGADQPEAVGANEPEAVEPTALPAGPALAPTEPPAPEPHFRGRSRVRRRARYLRKLREIQLRDIGGFAVELHRFARERPDLLAAKIAEAAQTDAELRALEEALGEEEPLRELREAGIGGVCGNCGAVHGSEDQFCATCGEPVGRNSRASRRSTEFDDYFSQG